MFAQSGCAKIERRFVADIYLRAPTKIRLPGKILLKAKSSLTFLGEKTPPKSAGTCFQISFQSQSHSSSHLPSFTRRATLHDQFQIYDTYK